MKSTKQRLKEIRDHAFRVHFHSQERVELFRHLPCEVTATQIYGRVVNAHTRGGGTARRGAYTSIVPLLWTVHTDFDEMPEVKFEAKYGRTKSSVRLRAAHYQQLWLEHVAK